MDYVIATHPDADHIAGLDKIILAFETECIYMPLTDKSNKEMNELYNVIENKNVINSTASDYFYLGNTKCTILNSGDTSKVSDIYDSIVLKDIIARFGIKDLDLFNRIVEYIVTTPSQILQLIVYQIILKTKIIAKYLK